MVEDCELGFPNLVLSASYDALNSPEGGWRTNPQFALDAVTIDTVSNRAETHQLEELPVFLPLLRVVVGENGHLVQSMPLIRLVQDLVPERLGPLSVDINVDYESEVGDLDVSCVFRVVDDGDLHTMNVQPPLL